MRTSPGANKLRLIRLLIQEGPRHRAEIARVLDTSRATVTTLVQQLHEERVVETVSSGPMPARGPEQPIDGPVRLKRPIGISTTRGLIVQLIFRSTTTLAAITGIDGRIIAANTKERPWSTDASSWLQDAYQQVSALLGSAGFSWEHVFHIHLALNSQVDRITGAIISSGASGPWEGVDPAGTARGWTPCTVTTENTARQIALAEYEALGTPRPLAAVYVYLTWGIGMGHVFDGRIVTGSRGAAGELGHISIDPSGKQCGCGNRGCLTLVAGLDSVLSRASDYLARPVDRIDDVVDAAEGGHENCRRLLEQTGEHVGEAMRTVCQLLAPDVLIVGGETARAGDLVIDPMRRVIKEGVLPLAIRHLEFVRASAEDNPDALFRAGHSSLVSSPAAMRALTARASG